MNSNNIKIQLHQLIDETEDVQLLNELAEQIKDAQKKNDWWEELSSSQQQRILESEQQYEKGQVISNEIVMEKIYQWLQK